MSIISTVTQAARSVISEVVPEDLTDESMGFDTLASLGIGPRAASRLARDLTEEFSGHVESGMLAAFMLGVGSERLVTNLHLGLIEPKDIHALAPEEAYEGADVEDIQDIVQILFGIDSADGIDMDTAMALFGQAALGINPETDPESEPVAAE